MANLRLYSEKATTLGWYNATMQLSSTDKEVSLEGKKSYLELMQKVSRLSPAQWIVTRNKVVTIPHQNQPHWYEFENRRVFRSTVRTGHSCNRQ